VVCFIFFFAALDAAAFSFKVFILSVLEIDFMFHEKIVVCIRPAPHARWLFYKTLWGLA